MSTPLLSQVVPETDANPLSFYSGGSRKGWGLGFREFAKFRRMK